MRTTWIALSLFAFALTGFAQLAPPNESGVSMGHLHFYTKDPAAHKKFWTELLGAEETKLANFQVFKIPGAVIFVQQADRTGGTEGSVVNHVAVKVRDLAAVGTKMEAAHITIATRTEQQAMVLAPDDIRLELTQDASLSTPIAYHHIHFYTAKVDEMKKWYVSMFGAIPGKRGRFEAADLPGVNLSFTPADATLAGTKGRVLDHIGFEVHGLEAFAKKLEDAGVKFNLPYRKIPALGISIAFLTDPWGTFIELTEGLDRL